METIKLLGRDYPLHCGVNAMRQIKRRFGGVEEAVEGLELEEDLFNKLDKSITLIAILANEGAKLHNFEHPDEPKLPALDDDIVGSAVTIAMLGAIEGKLVTTMNEGVGRNVFSMPEPDDEKNSTGA